MNDLNKKVYFKNITGLRFIAALMVIVHHIEQFKSLFSMDNYWSEGSFINSMGKLGVIFFFVLSGFLITYLLLEEEQKTGNIDVFSFYKRRIKRIWPLYYLIVFISLAILPFFDLFKIPNYDTASTFNDLGIKIIMFVFFLPNLLLVVFGAIPFAAHTWSIGTEEQFYFLWPILMFFIKSKRLVLLLGVIGVYLALGFILNQLSVKSTLPVQYLVNFWSTFHISCMAIGGIFAYIQFKKSNLASILQNNILFYFILLLTIVITFSGWSFPVLNYELYSLLFGIVILNFGCNETQGIQLEHPTWRYLGNISYGLYIYHPLCIVAVINLAQHYHLNSNLFIYAFAIILTVVLSGLSHRYYEQHFMRYR